MLVPTLRRLSRVSWWHWLAIFLVLLLVDYLVLPATGFIDQRGGDVMLRWHAASRPASSQVVVVDIDQRTLEDMASVAGSWPWPRSVHAELLTYLSQQQPAAIAFDILFNEPDVYRPDHDKLFAETVAELSNVYLATTLNMHGQGAPVSAFPSSLGVRATPMANQQARLPLMVPAAVFQALPQTQWGTVKAGLINFLEDDDHIGRRYHVSMMREGWQIDALPTRLARDLGWKVPEQPSIRLNWRKPPQHIAYADLYADAQREKPLRPPGELRGKVVLIGTGAPGLSDLRPTPLAGNYPAVDILATAIDNLRGDDWLREVPRPATVPFTVAGLVLLAWLFARGTSPTRIAYGLLGTNSAVLALFWAQLGAGWWLPVFAPLVWLWAYYWLCALLAYLRERRQREQTVGMFQRFLDPRVVGALVASGEIDTRINAESRDITVLFSDIRGFTTLSETRSPEFIVDLLNRYFSTQVEIIFRHGGTLDKFIGDAIMAFWGAPANDPEHARHAVAAAIEMSAALDRFKMELSDLGHDFEIGIGLNSGPAVVGFIGSKDRLDYTAIGDTVNLASRIEGQTKGVARVLIAESTRLAAGDHFTYRDCGAHHVKGREQEVRLFEPLAGDSKGETP